MKASNHGFTLFEMLIAIAVLALLIGLGVPSFRDFVRNSRMAAAANDIVTDFSLARSEAVKRRARITLCKSQDGAQCDADDAEPFRSWIVFLESPETGDLNGDGDCDDAGECQVNGQVDDGEEILRQRVIAETIDVVTNDDARRVTFLPSGFPDQDAAGNVVAFLLCDERGNTVSAGGSSAARIVEIMPTGRAVVGSREVADIDDAVDRLGFGGCP